MTMFVSSSRIYTLSVDCTAIANTDTNPTGQTSCVCATGYYWKENLCYKNCSIGPLDNGTNLLASTCGCKGSAFNQDGVCTLDCGQDTLSSGGMTTTACTCLSTAVWNSTLASCQIDCTAIAYSLNKTVSGSVTTCQCMTGFKWLNGLCVRDCTLITNATEVVGVSDCGCDNTFVWNGSICIKECSQDSQSTGVVTTSGLSCQCKTNYYWNSSMSGCTLNCSTVQYSLNSNPSTTECDCRSGFNGVTNSNGSFSCLPACSEMTGANGTSSDGQSCTCSAGYIWVSGVGCSLNCSTIPNSQGINDPVDPSVCLCNQGYNQSEGFCMLDCSVNSFTYDILTNASNCNCSSGAVNFGRICAQNCASLPYANPNVAPNAKG